MNSRKLETLVLGFLVIVLALAIYFSPTIIAEARGTPSGWIFLVNLLLGWTLIGWIIALIWAIRKRPAVPPHRVRFSISPDEV